MGKHVILRPVQWFVGLLFIFSGFIKANDPLGFSYKLQEYFEVFKITFLNDVATPIAILLCMLEILLGGLLILGIFKKFTLRGLLVTILFFTFLTFVSAAFNVVSSCGCFGDAIPLTPWQSFIKDVILLIAIIYLYKNQGHLPELVKHPGAKSACFSVLFTAPLMFGTWTYSYLPLIDFLPYHEGANIPAYMSMPEGAQPDEYAITYTLENKQTKESKKLSDKEYLAQEVWKDANWEIIGKPERKLVKKGYQVKIKDLIIANPDGIDYTKEIIQNPFYNLILVAYQIQDADTETLEEFNQLALNCEEQYNIRSVLLTSSGLEAVGTKIPMTTWNTEIFFVDAVPLKSMVRSNPGLILMKDGVVIKKWSSLQLPDFEDLEKNYFNKS